MANRTDKSKFKMPPKMKLALSAVILVGLLASCSGRSENWQHPSKPKDQWSSDIAVCKQRASTLIGRQLDIENDSSFRNRDELQVQFAAHDARKKRYSFFTSCLSGKGYRKVSAR
jgi:hypothetical protein